MQMTEKERAEARDAALRMMEMNRRSDMPPVPDFIRVSGAEPPQTEPPQTEPPQSDGVGIPHGRGKSLMSLLDFGKLKLDGDTGLIIAILVLLGSENCDELLMLALIYIML